MTTGILTYDFQYFVQNMYQTMPQYTYLQLFRHIFCVIILFLLWCIYNRRFFQWKGETFAEWHDIFRESCVLRSLVYSYSAISPQYSV